MSVKVSELTKMYGRQKAVDTISFEAKTGEIVGFLGPNGAGKSTTMKIATGYLSPTSGTIEVCGYDVQSQSMQVRRQIGYLPEHNPLYLDMYVREYLSFMGRLHKIRGSQLKNRLAEVMERCGLEPERSKKIGQLSKGYRQRVGLAQALLPDPPVLILDEPTTGLDPNQIIEIRQLIKEMGQAKTVIFSTHILPEVQAICQRVVVIHRGKIVADSPIAQLKNLLANQKTFLLEFENLLAPEDLAQAEGVQSVQQLSPHQFRVFAQADKEVRGAIFELAHKNGWVLLGLQAEESSLEDIFRQLTQKPS
ncbi:MAG: gliding motility-associated ABC transporter ATP-binding subunit GldA [Microscillaceae bacterium]|nr:gliding motility-associated ABC transporter ATP-binding subunit GldA [Microscillaceae bacterium]